MLDVYGKCRGDINGLYRGICANEPDKPELEASWPVITDFMQSIILLQRGMASPEFAARLISDISEHTDSPDTAGLLIELAESLYGPLGT